MLKNQHVRQRQQHKEQRHGSCSSVVVVVVVGLVKRKKKKKKKSFYKILSFFMRAENALVFRMFFVCILFLFTVLLSFHSKCSHEGEGQQVDCNLVVLAKRVENLLFTTMSTLWTMLPTM